MPNQMTFAEVDGYIVCYINGVEVSRAKKAADGTSTAEVIDIINDQIKANPTLAGTEPNLEGLEVSGDKYAVPQGGGGATLDDIVDSAGNRRFIEGDGTPATITEINYTYCKWSLSGTHLMLVCAGHFNSNYSLSSGVEIAVFNIPEWISEKIYPMGVLNILDQKSFYFFSYYGDKTGKEIRLKKGSNSLIIENQTAGTVSSNYDFRIQFDLLIDADYSE